MKAPPIKRAGGAPSKNDAAPASSKLIKVNPEQTVVEHLQAAVAGIERLPLLTGRLGCQFLDCLEFTDKIRTGYRDRVKEFLLKEPGAIPNWHVSQVPQRVLSKDTAQVFDALSREDDTPSPERFLEACSTNVGAVRKLLAERKPGIVPGSDRARLEPAS